jgi:hypothetical protein
MNTGRLGWAVAGILALSLILAFPLRDVLVRVIIVPLAYLFWVLGLLYRAMPQLIGWVLAVIIVLMLFLESLLPQERFAPRKFIRARPARGQVAELAASLAKTREGSYFKWLVANRLGKLAYGMLVQREGEGSRSIFAPLMGADWEPSSHLRKYLETGLHGSFMDYPASDRSRFFAGAPLDSEIEEAVAFLESQLEARRDEHR